MAAVLPDRSGCKILVQNIPVKADSSEPGQILLRLHDKLEIHFQKSRHGGAGNISSITFPRSNSERNEAVIEFEDPKTAQSVLRHQPHNFNGQDLVVKPFFGQALVETDAKLSNEFITKLSAARDLDIALSFVTKVTGAMIEHKIGRHCITGDWYKVTAAAERLDDLLNGQFTDAVPLKTGQAITPTTNTLQPQATVNPAQGQNDQASIVNMEFVEVNKDIHAYLKVVYPPLIKTIQQRYKVVIVQEEGVLKITPNGKAPSSGLSGAKKALMQYHSKFSDVCKIYIKLKDLPAITADETERVINAVRRKYPKVLVTKDTNNRHKNEILILSKSKAEVEEVVSWFRKCVTFVLENEEIFSYTFPKTNFVASVVRGVVAREKVDAVVAGLAPSNLNCEPFVSGGEKLRAELQNAWNGMKQTRNLDKVIHLSGGYGSLQCNNVLLFLDDANSNATFDVRRSLLKVFEYSKDRRFQKISLVLNRLGLHQSPKDVEEGVLEAVFTYCKQIYSDPSTPTLKIHLLHDNETSARSLAKQLKDSWIANFSLPPPAQLKPQTKEEDEDCAICLESLASGQQPLKALLCKHVFHQSCIDKAFSVAKKCPLCMTFFGKPEGNQPKTGFMSVREIPQRCQGYSCPTIEIRYHFPGGIQGPEHPNPGQPYYGTSRTAYLPRNAEGREVILLLRKAFDSRLTFTVGRSVTTGMDNCVTWNDIHHKTSMHGGSASFGYPDETYLSRLKEELKAKGIQ